MISVCFPDEPFNIKVIQVYTQPLLPKKLKLNGSMKTYRPSKTNTKKRRPFHHKELKCKSGIQEISGVTGKFGLGVQNEAGQRLTEFCKRTHWSWQTLSFNNTRDDSTNGHHQMVNTEIRLIIFFAAEDGEALYSQQKQDWELTVAQIMNSLLSNSDII